MATDLSSEQASVVSLTQSAADHIRAMQSEQSENAGKALRIYVEGGGCSGLQYGMVFDERRDGDLASESFGVPVLVDAASVEYVRGSVIDYSDALTGGGFKIQNPKARSSCGCGKSFEA